MTPFRILTALALAAFLIPSSDPASAGSFALHERSAEAQGASFAGAESGGSDITFAGFNPAALRNVENFELGANLSLILLDVEGDTFNPFTQSETSTGFTDPLVVPALALGYRLNDDLVLGITINSQFGLMTEYPNDALRWPAAGAALESRLTSVTVTPLISWDVTPELTIAAGPAIHYSDATLSRAVGAPGSLGSSFPEFPVGSLEGDMFGLGWQAGVILEPWEGTTLGLSYTSGYKLDIDGRFRSPAGSVDATAKADLPGVFGFGLRQALGEDVALMANARYFTWSRFSEIEVGLPPGYPDATEVTDYDDGYFLGLGIEADAGHGFTLRGGVAYDNSPTTAEFLSPRIPDSDRYWISLGASYRWSDSVKLDLAYSLILPEDSTVRANGATVFAPVDYSGQIHILSLGLSLSF